MFLFQRSSSLFDRLLSPLVSDNGNLIRGKTVSVFTTFPFFWCCFYNCVHNFVSRKVPSWQPTPPTKRVSNLIDCESLMKEKHAEEINLMFSCVVSHSGPAVSHKIAQLCKSVAMISAALSAQFKHVRRNYFVSNKSSGLFFLFFFGQRWP